MFLILLKNTAKNKIFQVSENKHFYLVTSKRQALVMFQLLILSFIGNYMGREGVPDRKQELGNFKTFLNATKKKLSFICIGLLSWIRCESIQSNLHTDCDNKDDDNITEMIILFPTLTMEEKCQA